jgi:hypothetical protein
MSDPLFKHTIPDGASIGPKSPGIVLIRFEASVAIYSLGYDSISIEIAEHDTQPFPIGIRVDVLFKKHGNRCRETRSRHEYLSFQTSP